MELFDALVAQLGAMDDAELRELIDVGEQQFAKDAYKTLAEAAALAVPAKTPVSEVVS